LFPRYCLSSGTSETIDTNTSSVNCDISKGSARDRTNKNTLPRRQGVLESLRFGESYFGVEVVFAALLPMVVFVVVFAGLVAEFDVVEFALFVVFEAAGVEAGVLTGATLVVLAALALFAGLLVLALLLAASPQAIPRALRPRTVESTITFFISKKTPKCFSKNSPFLTRASADRTQPFLLRTLSFSEQTLM
jgi:hypothetical protein